MPSPIAHAVSGYVIARVFNQRNSWLPNRRWWYWLSFYSVFIGIAADFDFIPQIITGEQFHRGITHTLIFAAGFSLCLAWLISRWQKIQFRQLFIITLIIYLSHLVLDWLTAGGNGIQLLAPFSKAYFKSALPLFPSVHHSKNLLNPIHLKFITWESIYCMLILISCGFWQKSSKKNYNKD